VKKNPLHRLGDLQLQILKVLWDKKESTVAEVHDVVGGDGRLAYTTVATMLRKMEVRGLVGHREEGRSFVYQAKVAEEDVGHGMAEHVLDRLFEGRLADLVSHLLTSREVSRDELARLERMISEHKRRS